MSFGRPPLRWPLVDITDSNSAALPVVIQTSGRVTGTFGDPTIENALGQSIGRYLAYLDCETLRIDDWLFSAAGPTPATRITSAQWAYPVASGSRSGLSPTTIPAYLHEGNRLEVDFSITQPDPSIRGGSANTDPIDFAANKITWIYMDRDGVVQLDVQPPATAAAPPAGFFAAVGVTTDGVEVTALDYTSTPEFELRVDAIPLVFGNTVVFEQDVTILGVINVNNDIFFNEDVTLGEEAGDIITALGTASFAELTTFDAGVQGTAGAAIELTGGATLPASKSIVGDATTTVTTGLVEAAAGIRAAVATPVDLTEGALITGGKSIVGDGSTSVETGTVDTIDENGRVVTGGITFHTDTTPGATESLVQWNGKRLSVGSEGQAVVLRSPFFDYVATATTTATSTDITGLNITVDVPPTQDVFLTLDAHQSVDAINGSLIRIRATNGVDSVAQLKLGDDDAAVSDLPAQKAANDRRPNSVRVRWRPTDDFPVPDNDTWSFFAQHGVSGADTLITTAATLTLQFL